jgi:hypothetical protein
LLLNTPYQDGGYESPSHLKGKVLVATELSNAGYVVEYEKAYWCKGNRQPFRVDMLLVAHNVFVEIDGATHNAKGAKAKDKWKDSLLLDEYHLESVRIPIEEALGNPEWVLTLVPPLLVNELERAHEIISRRAVEEQYSIRGVVEWLVSTPAHIVRKYEI